MRMLIAKTRWIIKKVVVGVSALLRSAHFWLLALLLAGTAFLVVGVAMLFGAAWSYVCAAICCFVFAFLIMLGLGRG